MPLKPSPTIALIYNTDFGEISLSPPLIDLYKKLKKRKKYFSEFENAIHTLAKLTYETGGRLERL